MHLKLKLNESWAESQNKVLDTIDNVLSSDPTFADRDRASEFLEGIIGWIREYARDNDLYLNESSINESDDSKEEYIDYKNATTEELKKWLDKNNDSREHSDKFNKFWLQVYKLFQRKMNALNESEESHFEEIASKSVQDSDGFTTDYTLYKDLDNNKYVCVFGDKDLYRPEDEDFDFETDYEEEAKEWFNSYEGFEDINEADTNSTTAFIDIDEILFYAEKYLNNVVGRGISIYKRPDGQFMITMLKSEVDKWLEVHDEINNIGNTNEAEESEATQVEDIAKKEEYKNMVTPSFKVGKKITSLEN